MKWYFACNDKSPGFFPLIKGAVTSALKNTTLEPFFIYDGAENELTEWLRERGVNIIHHRISFYNELENHYKIPHQLTIASGTFLRCDIPILEKDDDFVLYTDCDVLFLKDFSLDLKPEYFACSAEFKKHNRKLFNAGIMLMNVKKLRETHDAFIEFIKNNLSILSTYDQTAYQMYYANKASWLPVKYNHKPYWGIDKNAAIVHFHGIKPLSFMSDESLKHLSSICYNIFKKNPKAYDFYLNLFKQYYPEIEYDYDAIKKLKNGLYPLDKGPKQTFFSKIKKRLLAEYSLLKRE